jgi:hypothetical protein
MGNEEPPGLIDGRGGESSSLTMRLSNSNADATERLGEIAEILVTGLTRLRARKSSQISPDGGESSLDCAAHQSGHANALKTGGLE